MKKSYLSIGAAIVLAVAVIMSLTWWKSDKRTTVPTPSAAPSVAASRPASTNAEAKARAGRLRHPVPAATDPQAREAQREADRQESRKIVEAGRKRLIDQYRAERVDGSWAASKEQAIQALRTAPYIEEINAAPTHFDVDCRSSICRVTAEFPSRLAATDWSNLFPLSVATEMPNIVLDQTTTPDGTARVEAYGLARP